MWLNTRRFSRSTRKLAVFFPKDANGKDVELACAAAKKAERLTEKPEYKRLKQILLIHNPKMTEAALQEIIPFVIEKYSLDQTSIWNLDEEYIRDLVAGG